MTCGALGGFCCPPIPFEVTGGEPISEAVRRITHGGTRMKALLDDLVDFNRSKLGLGINLTPTELDLRALFESALEQLRAANPKREIQFVVDGNVQGRWDGNRLQQLLDNLVINALKYGIPNAPVCVALSGTTDDIVLKVSNCGPVIEDGLRSQIFDPLMRGPPPTDPTQHSDASLGLGLFISREIASAHGGSIEVDSDTTETVFRVRLPRRYETRRAASQ